VLLCRGETGQQRPQHDSTRTVEQSEARRGVRQERVLSHDDQVDSSWAAVTPAPDCGGTLTAATLANGSRLHGPRTAPGCSVEDRVAKSPVRGPSLGSSGRPAGAENAVPSPVSTIARTSPLSPSDARRLAVPRVTLAIHRVGLRRTRKHHQPTGPSRVTRTAGGRQPLKRFVPSLTARPAVGMAPAETSCTCTAALRFSDLMNPDGRHMPR